VKSNPSERGNLGQTSIQARSAELHDFADHSMSRVQAGEAVRVDLDALARLKGGDRSTALGTMGRIAESQSAYAEALQRRNPQVSDQAMTTAARQRDHIARLQTEYRESLEGMAAVPQADKLRETVRLAGLEHDERRAGRSYADLGLAKANRAPVAGTRGLKTPVIADKAVADTNSMRAEGNTAGKRGGSRTPVPPLEDRFNVMRTGWVEKEYHFREQAGKVAFTDKFTSISTGSVSPVAIKAMVDRAAERGWETLRLNGSPEFVRQGWIAATAQGLKAVGHTATAGDREAAVKERTRLQVNQDLPAPQRPGEAIVRVQATHVERVSSDRSASALGGQRLLAVAIEKALADGKVSPEVRGQVRDMMAAESARRVARGEQFKVPVYDSRAPRTRSKSAQTVAQRPGDRERSQ
jgi:hypothetical protein